MLSTSRLIRSPSPQARRYVRLTTESAEKLQYFENQDLLSLTESHARDMQSVLEVNALLRQSLMAAGLNADASVQELERMEAGQAVIRSLRESDDGVNRALVLSLQAELRRLRGDEGGKPKKGLGLAAEQVGLGLCGCFLWLTWL